MLLVTYLLLALIWALQHFKVYVGTGEKPVVAYTDHNPLTFLSSLHCPNQRLMRWTDEGHNLEVRHIKGRDNIMADALSRAPVGYLVCYQKLGGLTLC